MSLIQEALRRQQEESGDIPAEATPPPIQPAAPPPPPTPPPADGPAPPPVPTKAVATPPPPPPPQAAPPPPPTGAAPAAAPPTPEVGAGAKPLPTLAGIAALVLILIGGGVWMLVYAFQQWEGGEGDATGNGSTTDPDNPPAVVEQDPVPPANNGETDPDTAVTRPPTPPDNGGDVITPVTPPDQANINTDPLPAEWPLLQLTGVVGRGANGSVIINNEILGVGQSIEGAKIVAIATQGAWLEYRGEKRFLAIEFVSQ